MLLGDSNKMSYLCCHTLVITFMSQSKKKIIAISLLLLFAFYFANISFFYHCHTFNGYTISHSHIHGSNHTKTSTHTANGFSFILTQSNFQSLMATACTVAIGISWVCLAIFRIGTTCKIISVKPSTSYLRGPPAFV